MNIDFTIINMFGCVSDTAKYSRQNLSYPFVTILSRSFHIWFLASNFPVQDNITSFPTSACSRKSYKHRDNFSDWPFSFSLLFFLFCIYNWEYFPHCELTCSFPNFLYACGQRKMSFMIYAKFSTEKNRIWSLLSIPSVTTFCFGYRLACFIDKCLK